MNVKGKTNFFCFLCLFLLVSAIGSTKLEAAKASTGVEKPYKKEKNLYLNVTKAPYNAKKGEDVTSSIQFALDDASKKGTKKNPVTVYVPSGTYYLSSPLEINSNVKLLCENNTLFKKRGGYLYMLRSAELGKGGYQGVCNISVKGGIWDAGFLEYSDTSGGSLFFFAHANNLTFENVTLRNNFGTHLLELGAVSDVMVTGCTFYGFRSSDESTDKEAIQLDITHNDDIMPGAEPYDDTPCRNITITENEIYDYPRAVGTHSSVKSIYHDNITITNNSIHDIPAEAIYAYNYTNLTITKNTMENVGSGIVFKSYATKGQKTFFDRNTGIAAMPLPDSNYQVIIRENKILVPQQESGNSFGIFIYGEKDYKINGCSILDNEIQSNSSGIYIRYVGNSKIENNRIDKLGKSNFVDTAFSDDAIKLLSSPDNQILNNKISVGTKDSFINGIALRDSSTNVTIEKNQIQHPDKCGIAIYTNSEASLKENQITDAKSHGITLVSKAVALLQANTIKNSGKNGITITGASSIAIQDGNLVEGSKAHGVSATNGSFLSMQNSKSIRNQKNGLLVASSTAESILDNDFSGNGGKPYSTPSSKVISIKGNLE